MLCVACLLYVVCCVECVDRCWLLMFAVCCSLCYLSFACCAMCGCRCLLFVVRCSLIVGCSLEIVVWCSLLFVVRCALFVVCCLLSVVALCCLVFGV